MCEVNANVKVDSGKRRLAAGVGCAIAVRRKIHPLLKAVLVVLRQRLHNTNLCAKFVGRWLNSQILSGNLESVGRKRAIAMNILQSY